MRLKLRIQWPSFKGTRREPATLSVVPRGESSPAPLLASSAYPVPPRASYLKSAPTPYKLPTRETPPVLASTPIQDPVPAKTFAPFLSEVSESVERVAPAPVPLAVVAPVLEPTPEPPSVAAPAPVPMPSPFLSALMDQAGQGETETTKAATIRQILSPKLNVAKQANPSILRRTFSWLQKNYSPATKKQLRVSETVSLGEKRFVAIIHADGQKFLIGGGSTGVSLLTQLQAQPDSSNAQLSIHEVTERSA